jgi:glycosyltransferase involved in cell wall biosynthesis
MQSSDKIKLLFLTNDFSAGGVQRVIADFANNLNGSRFEVEIATLLDCPGYFFTTDSLHSEIPFVNLHFKKFWDLAGWYRLYRYIHIKHFDIVFTQLFMADFHGRIAAYIAGTPLIITEIQNLIPNIPKKYILVDRILRRITDICFSPTAAISDYAHNVIGYPLEKIVEIPTNSVDGKRFDTVVDRTAVRYTLDVPKDARLIVSVGRLTEQKGHTILLKALPLILKQVPNAHIIIVGGGSMNAELIAESKELAIEKNVTFAGVRKDIPAIMKSADVFAFPSLYEGQGVVLFEAMFSHLPIVASNVGGIPDVIKDGDTGLLTKPGDVQELAQALVRMLTDESLRNHVCEEALLRYGDRTLEHSAKKVGNILSRLYHKRVQQVIAPLR